MSVPGHRARREQTIGQIRGHRSGDYSSEALPSEQCTVCDESIPGEDVFFGEAGSVCASCLTTENLTARESAIQRQAALRNVLAPLGPATIATFMVLLMWFADPAELLVGKSGVGWPLICFVGIIWGTVTALQARATSFADDDTPTALVVSHWFSRAWTFVLGLSSAGISLFALVYPFLMRG